MKRFYYGLLAVVAILLGVVCIEIQPNGYLVELNIALELIADVIGVYAIITGGRVIEEILWEK